MPSIAWLLGFVATHLLTSLIFKLLTSLGIGYAVFSGIDVLITQLNTLITSSVTGTGSVTIAALQIAKLLRIEDAVNLIISAITTRYLFLGIVGGKLKKFEIHAASTGT